jgi:hypothetical protein
LPPEKLILWAHPHLLGLRGTAAEAEWTRFLRALGMLFPVPLPAQLGEIRFFCFNSRWEPFGVKAGGPDAQTAALATLLAAKRLRRNPSPRWRALRLASAKPLYYAVWVVFLAALVLRLFFL